MKTVVASSLLCLALGFLLGRQVTSPTPDESALPVTPSDRSPRLSQRQSRPPVSGKATSVPFATSHESLSGERRLLLAAQRTGYLATLSQEEIPEVLEMLLEKEREEAEGEIPRKISEEMLILLARWYELEGDSVLNWIAGSAEWERQSIFDAQMITLLDGFSRDPESSFEAVMAIQNATKANNPEGDVDPFAPDGDQYVYLSKFDDDLLYEIGRWSNRPLEMLKRLDPDGEYLEVDEAPGAYPSPDTGGFGNADFGFPVTHHSPNSYSYNDEMESFARGLIESGRHDLARAFMRDLEGGAKLAFQEVIAEEAAKGGWQEIKRQIDNGTLDNRSHYYSEVLQEFAQSDRQGALDWYLSLPAVEGVGREYQISEAVSSGGAFDVQLPPSDNPFANESFIDFEAALSWLDQQQARGEPINRALSVLRHEAIRAEEWETVLRLHQRLPEGKRRTFEEGIVSGAINRDEDTFLGQKFTWASPEDSTQLRAAEVLGLLSQVEALAEETNARSRAALRSLVERLKTDAAQ